MAMEPLSALRPLKAYAYVVSVALLITTGCQVDDPYRPTDSDESRRAAMTLTSLPSLEDTESQMMSVIEELGQRISERVPDVRYQWRREPSGAGCSPPFEQTDGELIYLPKFVSHNPIPERHWNAAYEMARQTAAALGAHSVTVYKDAPDDHDVQFSGDTGTTLRFGSQASALITGSTGCRLPRGVKERAS